MNLNITEPDLLELGFKYSDDGTTCMDYIVNSSLYISYFPGDAHPFALVMPGNFIDLNINSIEDLKSAINLVTVKYE